MASREGPETSGDLRAQVKLLTELQYINKNGPFWMYFSHFSSKFLTHFLYRVVENLSRISVFGCIGSFLGCMVCHFRKLRKSGEKPTIFSGKRPF